VVSEIIKLVVAAAIIVIAAVMIALFASGYISAFKPGGTNEAAGEHVVGSSNTIGGGVSTVSKPATPPSPQPGHGMPETLQMPPMPEPTMPPEQPVMPIPTPAIPMAPGTQPNPYSPITQPSMPGTGPGEWPDSRIIRDRPTPMPVAPPSMQAPSRGESPGSGWPIALLPGQDGWMQVSNWLLRLVPVIFPGLYPGWTWWS
jgi:hypothetical protein